MWVCNDGCKSACGGDLASYSRCSPHFSNATNSSTCYQNVGSREYRYRAIFDEMSMPWDWPVIVNYHEVKAFCRWKGPDYRAPTEAEHHCMRGDPIPSCDVACDPAFNAKYSSNINFKYGSPTPVNMFIASPTGHYDVYGNLWEWCEDHFNGFPGSCTNYLYEDFSTPYYDSKHTMIMGGSWISTGDECSRFSRNWFRRHFYQHAGFRLARSSNMTPVRLCKAEVDRVGKIPLLVPNISENCWHKSLNQQFEYETDQSLINELSFNYEDVMGYGHSLKNLVEGIIHKNFEIRRTSALVLGCGAGFSTFLLTKHFQKVLGIDYCARYVDIACAIQAGRKIPNGFTDIQTLHGMNITKTIFKQLTWIPNEVKDHDFVLIEFLDRVTEPKGWLRKLWETLSQHAIVVIVASSKWDKIHVQSFIGKWFECAEQGIVIANKTVTIWRYR